MDHKFNVSIAEKYGMAEAVLLEGLSFWCMSNKANGRNIKGGLAYTFNSIKALHDLYPYLSEKKIRTALAKLEEAGIIVSGSFNKNSYDRTKWYAVTEKGFAEMGNSICPKRQMDFAEKANGNVRKGEPIPFDSTVKSPLGSVGKTSQKPQEPRHRLGEFGHVLLSDEDEAKLDEQFPGFWRDYITRVDEYCEQSGKRYRNYRLTISKWIRRDQQTGSVKSDASCTAPVGEAYVGAAERSPRERLIKDYMNSTGKGGFPSSCCAHYDWCVQNGVPEYVEADRLTKEWVAAGGTERQFPRSKYPWNPRP